MGTKHTDPLPKDTPPNTWPDYLWHTHTHTTHALLTAYM